MKTATTSRKAAMPEDQRPQAVAVLQQATVTVQPTPDGGTRTTVEVRSTRVERR